MTEREQIVSYAKSMVFQDEDTLCGWCVQGLLDIVEQQTARITYLERMVDDRWLIEEKVA